MKNESISYRLQLIGIESETLSGALRECLKVYKATTELIFERSDLEYQYLKRYTTSLNVYRVITYLELDRLASETTSHRIDTIESPFYDSEVKEDLHTFIDDNRDCLLYEGVTDSSLALDAQMLKFKQALSTGYLE